MRSALYLAIESDNFGVAEILANHGASVIADSGRLAKMLCQIGFDNDLKKLSFLVKCDCDIMQSDYDMRTVGHLAAAEGNVKMLEFLASSSAFDFSIKDRWGSSVLSELKDQKAKAHIESLIEERARAKQTREARKRGFSETFDGP